MLYPSRWAYAPNIRGPTRCGSRCLLCLTFRAASRERVVMVGPLLRIVRQLRLKFSYNGHEGPCLLESLGERNPTTVAATRSRDRIARNAATFSSVGSMPQKSPIPGNRQTHCARSRSGSSSTEPSHAWINSAPCNHPTFIGLDFAAWVVTLFFVL